MRRALSLRFSVFLLWMVMLPVMVSAKQEEKPMIWDDTPREPAYSFVVEKRRFFNPDAPTTGTLPDDTMEMLQQSGWSERRMDDASGEEYIARRSAIAISPDANGDLDITEVVLVQQGTREIMLRKKPLKIPVVTNRYASVNLLMARHPLAMVLPRYKEIIALDYPEGLFIPGAGRKPPEVVLNEWLFVITPDRESGKVSSIAQYHKKTRQLVKRIVFEGWHKAPSGREIPQNVYMRTYLGDDTRPFVEVRFVNIEEEQILSSQTPQGIQPVQ